MHPTRADKKETLMVKERTSVAQSQVVLVLDLSGQRDTVEEVLGHYRGPRLLRNFLLHRYKTEQILDGERMDTKLQIATIFASKR